MNFRTYIPAPPLSDFVELLWYFEGGGNSHALERVLPNGSMEIVINLHEDLIRSYDSHDPARFESMPGSVVAGTRSEFMVIDTASQRSLMGVAFRPGGAFPFLGLPSHELHGRDVALDAFWGSHAGRLRERLLEAEPLAARFRILEDALVQRAFRPLERHRAVAFALEQLRVVPNVRSLADVAGEIGFSQKRFIEAFRQEVGMTPKLYYRIRRFQEALRRIGSGRPLEWADLALSWAITTSPISSAISAPSPASTPPPTSQTAAIT